MTCMHGRMDRGRGEGTFMQVETCVCEGERQVGGVEICPIIQVGEGCMPCMGERTWGCL